MKIWRAPNRIGNFPSVLGTKNIHLEVFLLLAPGAAP